MILLGGGGSPLIFFFLFNIYHICYRHIYHILTFQTSGDTWLVAFYLLILQRETVTGCLHTWTERHFRKESTLKGNHLLCRSKFFPVNVEPYEKGVVQQNKNGRIASPESVPIYLDKFLCLISSFISDFWLSGRQCRPMTWIRHFLSGSTFFL